MADNYFGLSDTGRVRTNNEDAFIAEKVLQERFIAACVIDGVGGYEGGEVAAAIARQAMLDYLSVPSGDVITMMREAFVVANEKISAEKKKRPEYESMACVVTLALADVAAKTFYYAHIGDTRLYLLRDKTLVKITKDQSFVGYLEDSGRIGEAEAMQHPKRNEINNALGFGPQLNATDIETGSSPFLPGDLLLLCSDGLSDLVKRNEMLTALQQDGTLQAKAKTLVQQANERGGKDNITVVLVRNHKKPTVQKATRPIAATDNVKKNETPGEASNENSIPEVRKRQKSNVAAVVFGLLSLLLAITIVLLLVQKQAQTKSAAPLVVGKSSQEAALQEVLDTATGAIFFPDSMTVVPVVMNDTLWIRQDSLHLKGNGMRFLKSSFFAGPALAISDSCKWVMLENLSFENLDIAVLVQNKALHLKNVRFINCRVPVQAQIFLPDAVPVSGTVSNIFSTDSLHP